MFAYQQSKHKKNPYLDWLNHNPDQGKYLFLIGWHNITLPSDWLIQERMRVSQESQCVCWMVWSRGWGLLEQCSVQTQVWWGDQWDGKHCLNIQSKILFMSAALAFKIRNIFSSKSREEDNLSEQVQEELLKISIDFCSYLRDLPGDNREINDIDPEAIWYHS